MNDDKLASLIDRWDSWRFGSAPKKIVALAKELEEIRSISADVANRTGETGMRKCFSELQTKKLSLWLHRVKDAVDAGEYDFFSDLAAALRLLEFKPSASQSAAHFAWLVLLDYRRAGIEPRKADIEEETEDFLRFLESLGKVSRGTVAWQRDVWKRPEFKGIKKRRRGEQPRPLPEEWR